MNCDPACLGLNLLHKPNNFKDESGLDKDSTIMLNQIRIIDNLRLIKKIDLLNNFMMNKVDRAIKVSLALD